MVLEDDEKRELLRIARTSIESALNIRSADNPPASSGHLLELHGVFVTLRIKGELRGCIGYVEPRLPLYRSVGEIARKAAFEDPRFPPLRSDETSEVEIEISVLSPLEKVRDFGTIVVGKHGVVIEAGMLRGLLLPHVAREYDWGREELLNHAALKAGLPPEGWKRRDAQVYTFTANTFSESELYELH